ncbi:TPA: putative toxin-antitoxin system toxin component, PIN family [Candidatus Bathyarchaeota archaeon]|nr:putative toxin-antitoxin system toxin component, PIN family [Candidatus Bathyarchaeota archaeon]
MRIVLDTNVLISALIGHGKPRRLLIRLFREHESVSSRQMLAELEDVLSRRKFGLTRSRVDEFLGILVKRFIVSEVEKIPEVISEDPDDDVVLATALAGGADYIVTGDGHLLGLREYQGIRIVRVGEMLKAL